MFWMFIPSPHYAARWITLNSNAFFAGIDSHLKKPILFCGGGASDNINAYKTYQFHNGMVFSDSASCILISGEANIEQLSVMAACQ
jgi:hypothetical protein